ASNGKAFYTMYDWAKARDKSRPVQYEQASLQDRNSDIFCPMYPSWEWMNSYASKDQKKPFIMCEYAHAMGNSMGNFQEYWDVMRRSKNMQGGFIWEWYNHGFKTRDEQGREYWAYGGDLNGYNKANDGNFCMDGVVSPDQQYLPHTHIVKKVYQDILFESKAPATGLITIINDFKFIPITPRDYYYQWKLLRNGQEVGTGKFEITVEADSRKDIKLQLPPMDSSAGSEYFLQVFAMRKSATKFLPGDFESAKGEFQIAPNGFFTSKSASDKTLPTLQEDKDKITISANQLTYVFYKNVKGISIY
ncbi:MAG: DUF4981 domain-containing protein, partial [Chryseobacterium sp.]